MQSARSQLLLGWWCWLALACSAPHEDPVSTVRPSCAWQGGRECRAQSCCTSLEVPAQSFTLGGKVEMPTAAASVSAFSLDVYEVTVGRFSAFVAAYDDWRAAGNPRVGAGAHPLIADSGWRSEWQLPGKGGELAIDTECSDLTQTFTTENPQLPINCVTWVEAFAFCIWDGGRLPTEAEWEAAAAGGDEERPFPWGREEPDNTRAAFDCTGDGSVAQDCARSDILAVGSKPGGAGRWGHQDLAGNVWEWVLDWYEAYPPAAFDYANVGTGSYRTIRGSGWYSEAADLRSPLRYNNVPSARRSEFGFRCAGAH